MGMDFFKTGWVYHWDAGAIEIGQADNIGSIRSGEIVPSNPESSAVITPATNHHYPVLMDNGCCKKLLQILYLIATRAASKDEKVFKWLDYIPGETAKYNNLHGGDWVLSGPMSGCQIVRFKATGYDNWSCAHIGTAATNPIDNRMVKDKFCAFLTSGEVASQEVQGFNPGVAVDPSDLIQFSTKWGLSGSSKPDIYLCMSKEKCYAVSLFRLPLQGATSLFWLCGPIYECAALSRGELIQALRKPKEDEKVYERRHGAGSLEQEIRRRMREREREAMMLSAGAA